MRTPLAALVAVAAAASGAGAGDLPALLAAVADNARFERPTRADARIVTAAGTETRAILLGRGDAVFVEVRNGVRALLRGRTVVTAPPQAGGGTTALAATNVLLDDLVVFDPGALVFPQISDDGPAGVVITGAPAGRSPYALVVHTIDRARRSIVKTQYYEGSVSNLTKIRRDRELIEVDGHWRPTEITVESFPDGRKTTLTLAWRPAPDAPPRLFDPAGLDKPSGLPSP